MMNEIQMRVEVERGEGVTRSVGKWLCILCMYVSVCMYVRMCVLCVGGAPNYFPNSFNGPLDHPSHAISKTTVVCTYIHAPHTHTYVRTYIHMYIHTCMHSIHTFT